MNMILLALAAQFAAFFVTSLLAGFLVALATLASGRPAGYDAIRFWGPVSRRRSSDHRYRAGRLGLSLHPCGSRPFAAASDHDSAGKETARALAG